jgi:Predicted transcriptional regulators
MSLAHAILGWLNVEPMTGYDLNQVIEISTQHFWSTSQSQIYRTLSKIESRGWVAKEVIMQADRPPRKVYHITEAGQSELESWIVTFHKPLPPRIPWLIQVFFAGQVSDEAIVSVLEKKLANLRQRLQKISASRAISASQFDEDEDPRDVFYWMLTIDYGETNLQAQIDWIGRTLEKIKSREYEKLNLAALKGSPGEQDKNHV